MDVEALLLGEKLVDGVLYAYKTIDKPSRESMFAPLARVIF